MKRFVVSVFSVWLLATQICYADYDEEIDYPSSYSSDVTAEDYSNAFPEPISRDDVYEKFVPESNDFSEGEDSSQHPHFAKHGKLPASIPSQGEPVIIVNPHIHEWGAYSANGTLLRSGLATAGASWCNDIDRPCRTKTGTFRIYSLGDEDCYSRQYPVGEGGAPMPYCMYFNGGQGIHGSNELAHANLSHGCVRVSVSDARWIRYNFAQLYTKVVIEPY